MAFTLELQVTSTQKHIKDFIVAKIRKYGIKVDVFQEEWRLLFVFDSEHKDLQKCLDSIAKNLPVSLFLKGSKNYESGSTPKKIPEFSHIYPLSLGLCPECQKEMMDVSSKRYYYPFTSCSCCGANHSFLVEYPYKRQNTSMKFLVPCASCQEEMQSAGRKEWHVINSCHECGVPVRLVHKTNERYANDAGSFRTMFEVAAKAIVDEKRLLIKTTMGYRLFYKAEYLNNRSILMMINANKITDHLALITEEYQALLSIERPVLYVALKNEMLKEKTGANTNYVKYPDDGFSILLGVELQKLGIDFIAYEEVQEDTDADIVMDYDLQINSQSDISCFINKDTQFIASGERVSFPTVIDQKSDYLSIANQYVGVTFEDNTLFDRMEYFENMSFKATKANVLEGDLYEYHANQYEFSEDIASFMAVIAEHKRFGVKCVGAYFENDPSFLYYDGKKAIRIVPPKPFDGNNIIEAIKNLREGSDRLVANLEKNHPQIFAKLVLLEQTDGVTLFEAVATLLDLDEISYLAVMKEAMKFVGKGGVQIDTHVKDNRFDNTAFLASIISYQLAGVSAEIIAYSIFESFGDYFHDILQELKAKTKAQEFVLCGSHFANQSLFSRMQRNLKMTPPLMSKSFPIGKESAVVGGIYL